MAKEVDKVEFRRINVGLTAVFTLLTAYLQGEVDSPLDALRHLGIGSTAGYGFYQAKRIAGHGRTTEGWLLTNAATTIIENTSSGEHPFGSIGYTAGPFRLRFATPLTRKAVAKVEADWSLAETAFLVMAWSEGDRVRFRDGLIAIDRDTKWPDPDVEGGTFDGRTFGVFPGVAPDVPETIWHHEVVHAIQNQQMDAVEPPVRTLGRPSDGSRPERLFMFRHVRLGFTHLMNVPTYERPYQERWLEIEAHGLAEGKPVPRRH